MSLQLHYLTIVLSEVGRSSSYPHPQLWYSLVSIIVAIIFHTIIIVTIIILAIIIVAIIIPTIIILAIILTIIFVIIIIPFEKEFINYSSQWPPLLFELIFLQRMQESLGSRSTISPKIYSLFLSFSTPLTLHILGFIALRDSLTL